MKKILLLIIAIITTVTMSAQEWKSVDLSNEWQPESSEQKALSITTYEGHHVFLYEDRDIIVISPSGGKVANRKYEPVSAKVLVLFYNGQGMQTKRCKITMLYNKNYSFGIIQSSDLMKYLSNNDGFVRIKHFGKYGFNIELPTLIAYKQE